MSLEQKSNLNPRNSNLNLKKLFERKEEQLELENNEENCIKVIVASTFFHRSLGLISKQFPISLRLISKKKQQSLGLIPERLQQRLRLILKRSWRCAGSPAEYTTLSPSTPGPDALFFPCCQSLHTIGMVRSVDIAFIDAQNRVLASRREVPPLQIVSCPGASGALERFSQDSLWPEQGEIVRLTEVK